MNLCKFKIYPDCIYRIIRPRNLKWVAEIAVAEWTFAVRFHAPCKNNETFFVLPMRSSRIDKKKNWPTSLKIYSYF